MYDPYTGTFTQPDPIQEGGANAYGYADGDPVNKTDLSGDEPCGEAGEVGDFPGLVGNVVGWITGSGACPGQEAGDRVGNSLKTAVLLGVAGEASDGAADGVFDGAEGDAADLFKAKPAEDAAGASKASPGTPRIECVALARPSCVNNRRSRRSRLCHSLPVSAGCVSSACQPLPRCTTFLSLASPGSTR